MTAAPTPVPANRESPSARRAFRTLADDRPIVICSGSGGVGKTTVSATFALEGARRGRRACVVTVDPARRLADALGVESLANTPSLVEGPWSGELHALMLDTKGTFDDLVERYARTSEQASAIQSNRIYQNLTGALSGTQEYMAMEKLYELSETGRYDLVVVDTPPTRNALDLLDAPRRLTNFLEHRLFRALLLPTRVSLRALGLATHALLRTIAKVAGAEIVHDAVAFFQAFEGMEEGFRVRAAAVRKLLAEPSTAYVLVTSPRPSAVEEATYFADKLAATGIVPAGLIVNRAHPWFGPPNPAGPLPPIGPGPRPSAAWAAIEANLDALDRIAAREEETYRQLASRVSPAPVALVPLLGTDVHDLDGLAQVGGHLFGPTPTGNPAPVG